MRINFSNALAVNGLLQNFLEFWREFKVFMLHRESHFNEIVEAKIFREAIVELSALKLLEEKDKNFCKTVWVVILDCQVTLAFEATNETLDEEIHREGEVRTIFVPFNVRHESNSSDRSIFIGCMLINGFKSNLNLRRGIVLVKVYHLNII